jgi:4,5-DOPA dioxygenase extradiol
MENSATPEERMPVIFLSHGAPPLADDPVWTQQLADWSSSIPKPRSVLMISAHWENDPLTVSATRTVPLFYDFWGFPERYYQVKYPAPGAPELADEVFDIGRRLAPLRQQGVLIVGSGFSTHNLREMNWHAGPEGHPPNWSVEFDDWLGQQVLAQNVDALINFEHSAPAAALAHPRTEHFAPLFISLGAAADQGLVSKTPVTGFWFGLSKRSVQFV